MAETLLCVLAATAVVGGTINIRRNRWQKYISPDVDRGHPEDPVAPDEQSPEPAGVRQP